VSTGHTASVYRSLVAVTVVRKGDIDVLINIRSKSLQPVIKVTGNAVPGPLIPGPLIIYKGSGNGVPPRNCWRAFPGPTQPLMIQAG